MDTVTRALNAQQAINNLGAGKYGDSTIIKHRSDTNGPCLACIQRDKRVELRSEHWAAYRRGEWALITGVSWAGVEDGSARACYILRFEDGAIDYWPIDDPTADYEFRLSMSHGS